MADEQAIRYCSQCLTTFPSDAEQCPNLGCARPRPAEGWGKMYSSGDVIDRNYEVIERLALGGAGVTYLVKALNDQGQMSGPRIALKLLFASRDHGSYLRRLSTEAQILQELQHPNIVKYLGFVHRTGHSPYLLTHFEQGGSLLDYMRDVGTVGIREAASIGRQVCWALAKGHAQGIIHRDLKPENLLLAERPRMGESPIIRVADFGIAKVSGSLNAGLTRAGAFVGTPQYAAPEQFLGEPASDKADVYALGAVMTFLMTARPLVKDAHLLSPEDVYTQLLDALPPTVNCAQESPDDNEAINQVLARAMCMEPQERCTVSDLDRMLSDVLGGKSPTAPVMSLHQQEQAANIPLSVFSDATGGLTISGDYTGAMAARPSPTLRDDEVELEEDVGDRPESDEQTTKEDRFSDIESRKGGLGTRHFLLSTLGFLVLAIGVWLAMLVTGEPPPEPVAQEAVIEKPQPVEVAVVEEKVEEPPESEEKKAKTPPPPEIIDAIRNPGLGKEARTAASRAFKRNAQTIRRLCPQAVGSRIQVDVLMSTSGQVSWARPVLRNRSEYKCVADNMKRVKSGSRFRLPTKVRLYVEP